MATIILGVAGAAIGSAFGNPALGFSIGATIGSLIDGPKGQDQETGKLDDLKVTTSTYGTAIPQVWGNMRTGGNVLWATDLQQHKHTQRQGGKGGGGGTSTSYTYSVSLAVLVCAGRPGLTVSRILANDLTLWEAGHAGNVVSPRFYDGSEAQTPDPLIAAHEGDAPAFRGLNYFVLEDFDLSKFGNAVPNLQVETVQAGVTVGGILADLSRLAGLSDADFDYSAATDAVRGFAVAQRAAARDTALPLLSAYLTDLTECDGMLRAVKRGGAPALALTLDDLGASVSGGGPGGERLQEKRQQEAELPWRVDVRYYSAEAGKSFEQGSQAALRIGAPQQQSTSIDVPLALLDDEARAIAEQQVEQAWVERSPTQLLLPPRYLALAPADIVTLPAGDGIGARPRRLRLLSLGIGLPGVLALSCVDDDSALPAQVRPPGSALPPAGGSRLAAVNTDFVIWSSLELRDEDGTQPGFYLAATGADGWPGAAIFYSANGTDWVAGGTVSARSVFGTATAALADGAGGAGFDTAHTASVSVNGVLESVSQGEAQAGVNAARLGSEYLAFADAALVAAGQYTLGTLLRGLRGSPVTGHAAGEPFVLLDPQSLARVAVPPALIGQTLQVKCVSDYQSLGDVVAQEVTIAGNHPPYATTGELTTTVAAAVDTAVGTAFAAVRPPVYWRLKGYVNSGRGTGDRVDASYFDGGAHVPAGTVQLAWTEYAAGPGGSFRWTGNVNWALWARLGLKNTTGAGVTVHWAVPFVDNYCHLIWGGAALLDKNTNDGGLTNNAGTFTVAAGSQGVLDAFFFNEESAAVDSGDNPLLFMVILDALDQAGMQFYDPGP